MAKGFKIHGIEDAKGKRFEVVGDYEWDDGAGIAYETLMDEDAAVYVAQYKTDEDRIPDHTRPFRLDMVADADE